MGNGVDVQTREEVKRLIDRRPVAGFALSLISGIFIILNAALLSWVYVFASFYFITHQPPWIWHRHLTVPAWFLLFPMVFGALCGLAVLVGAYCLYKGRNVLGGVLVILFSVLSLPIGGLRRRPHTGSCRRSLSTGRRVMWDKT